VKERPKKKPVSQRKLTRLPAMLRPFFWSYDFAKLSWEKDSHLVTYQILTAGDWQATVWLRKRLGDAALRAWILERDGRGLSNRQLRFWELILDLPHRQVNAWLAQPERQLWENRLHARPSK